MATRRLLLWCGVIAPVLFTVAYLIEGASRAGYDALRDPVSSLSLGEFGWTQTANFIMTGLLFLAFALGLSGEGKALPVLTGVIGIGLIGAGLFRTDPVGARADSTTLGTLHDLFSLGVFFGLPLACLVAVYRFGRARRFGWLTYSLVTAVVFFVFFVLAGAGFSGEETFVPIGGLMQRLSLTVGLTWLALLAWDNLRRS